MFIFKNNKPISFGIIIKNVQTTSDINGMFSSFEKSVNFNKLPIFPSG